MITTHFLTTDDLDRYGTWLKQQDAETLSMYFGITPNDAYIGNLIDSMKINGDRHHILVAVKMDRWVGTLHMVDMDGGEQVEFGLLVDRDHRDQGIGDRLMDEGITWVRNRGFARLYLHCLSWNQPIKRLCRKHGLHIKNQGGDSDAEIDIPKPSFFSIGKEFRAQQKNIYTMLLKGTLITFRELYG